MRAVEKVAGHPPMPCAWLVAPSLLTTVQIPTRSSASHARNLASSSHRGDAEAREKGVEDVERERDVDREM